MRCYFADWTLTFYLKHGSSKLTTSNEKNIFRQTSVLKQTVRRIYIQPEKTQELEIENNFSYTVRQNWHFSILIREQLSQQR